MRFEDLMHDVVVLVARALNDAQEVNAVQLGLDPRSTYSPLRVTEDYIAVPLTQDERMRYYGGFEYVDADHRQVLGEWVFYLAESERVLGHLCHVFPELESQLEE